MTWFSLADLQNVREVQGKKGKEDPVLDMTKKLVFIYQ